MPGNTDLFSTQPGSLAVKGRFVEVALPTPVDRLFDYAVPDPLAQRARVGHRVTVPFGRRSLQGIVVGEKAESTLPPAQIREVLEAPDDAPLVDEAMRRLTRWMAEYYACTWGEALQAVLPAVIRTGRKRRTVPVLRLARTIEETLAQAAALEQKVRESGKGERLLAHARILRALGTFTTDSFSPAHLAERLGCSQAPIHTLCKQGWLRIEKVEVDAATAMTAGLGSEALPPALSPEQQAALEAVNASLRRDEFHTFLLFGVTGSGKTEVYIRAMEQALALGKSAILLVPEIALTPQTLRRFSARFADISVLHSAMTDAERRDAWKRIREGVSRVVIGPRSALFAPVKDLGLVVIDEEHEATYKQDSTPRYHARDTAIMRCRLEGAVALLGSATPSLETWHNAATGKYALLELPRRVAGGTAAAPAAMARVEIVDMAQECREQRGFAFFSRRLRGACAQALERGEQVMIFLNRRGYHTMLNCGNCGQAMMCTRCAIPMSYHRGLRKMTCHYCLETADQPRQCPHCGGGPLKLAGMGTERLEEELKTMFAGHDVARMDSDVMKTREDYETALEGFRSGQTRILVGTQMIAKGLDFPDVTVVGVVSADVGLGLGDFRSYERAFQLITQVAGRAGRGSKPGVVVVQTFQPQHVAIQTGARQDYREFVGFELNHRRESHYPPFARLVLLTVEAAERAKAEEAGARLAAAAQDFARRFAGTVYSVGGPFEAPIGMLRGRHRQQVLVKAKGFREVRGVVDSLRPLFKAGEKLRISADVDPVDML
ncbi:MAG: primosomal protein N' [Planctomycetes bacterium]|nr:primosomal protein N' [Planctomycetota bacterium]